MTTLRDEERRDSVLQALAVVRSFAPDEAHKYERRIRFAAARVDDLRRPADGEPVRADRVLMVVEILDQYLTRAETFLDQVSSECLVRHVA